MLGMTASRANLRTEQPEQGSEATQVALLLAAHGERSRGAENSGVMRLAAALRARGIVPEVAVGFVKGTPTITESVRALHANQILVYPLLLSDGYFTQTRLPQMLNEATGADVRRRIQVLAPLGLDTALAPLLIGKLVDAAEGRGLAYTEAGVILLAHGSSKDPASRLAAERIAADVIRRAEVVMAGLVPAIHVFARGKEVHERPKAGHDGGSASFRAVRVALLEESPSLQEAAAELPGPVIIFGLFMGEGLHGAGDAPRLVQELGRPDAVYAGTLAQLDGIEEVVAAAVGRAMQGLR